MKGVIDLRGKVTPVIDLRLKFGVAGVACTEPTCIIVMQVKNGTGSLVMGMVVDEVPEVIAVAAGDIEDTPDFGVRVAKDYLLGMARALGKVKILFDIDAVVTSQEIHGLEAVIQ